MDGVLAWTRLDLRRRGRSVLALTLLIAVAGGIVLATLAGARRTDSAVSRLRATTLPADAMVLVNEDGFDWDPVRRLPSVATVGTFSLSLQDYSVVQVDPPASGADTSDALFFPSGDPEIFNTLERRHLTSGRQADPNNPDEATAETGFIKRFGDEITVRMPSKAQLAHLNQLIDEGKLDPNAAFPSSITLDTVVHIHVVGEGRSVFGASDLGGIQLIPSYGFWKKYVRGQMPDRRNALVRLRQGQAGIPAFTRELSALTGGQPIDIVDLKDKTAQSIQKSLTFTGEGWALFAAVAFIASLVLIGQAFVRFSAGATSDLETLNALGLTRGQALLAAAASPATAAVVGAALAIGVGFALSPLFPTGIAPSVEPSPGLSFDALVLLLGALLIALVGIVGALAAALLTRPGRTPRPVTRSVVAAAITRAGFGVVPTLGTRFALESGRGRSRVPARPALIGAVAAVVGVVGALTFRAGLDQAAHDPTRFGQTLPNTLSFGPGAPPPEALAAVRAAAKSPDIAVLDDMRVNVFTIDGRSVTTFGLDPLKGTVPIVALAGRGPQSADEISLGPVTAKATHLGVGDTVTVAGHALRVSGITFVPKDSHNDYTDGAWVTAAGMTAVQPDPTRDKYHRVRFAWVPHTDATAALKRLGPLGEEVFPGEVPEAQTDLLNVQSQPLLLGGFLVLLGLAALAHALTTAIRRRRHDVAVLRAVGMTRRQARLTVATQASVIALVGLIFGIPLGIAAGRGAWQVLAHATPVSYAAPLAALAVLLVGPIGLAVANLLAALPARRAARIRPAEVLRAE